MPIIVGGNDSIHYPVFVRDNTGDEISEKNPNYCELTALYWIWKNADSAITGLCHYRRYFTTGLFAELQKKAVDIKHIGHIMKNYDIILPMPIFFGNHTIQEQLIESSVKSEDLFMLRDIIRERHSSYLGAYDRIMSGHLISCYNMMICRKEQWDAYCAWLFDILFALEKKVSLEGRTDYQKRIYGFLSERLLNVWVMKQSLKVKYMHVLEVESNASVKSVLLRRIKSCVWKRKHI